MEEYKKSYRNNYSVSEIHDYFKCIKNKHELLAAKPQVETSTKFRAELTFNTESEYSTLDMNLDS